MERKSFLEMQLQCARLFQDVLWRCMPSTPILRARSSLWKYCYNFSIPMNFSSANSAFQHLEINFPEQLYRTNESTKCTESTWEVIKVCNIHCSAETILPKLVGSWNCEHASRLSCCLSRLRKHSQINFVTLVQISRRKVWKAFSFEKLYRVAGLKVTAVYYYKTSRKWESLLLITNFSPRQTLHINLSWGFFSWGLQIIIAKAFLQGASRDAFIALRLKW